MDELMLLSTYLPWVRHQIGRLFAGPLSSSLVRPAALCPLRSATASARPGATVFARRNVSAAAQAAAVSSPPPASTVGSSGG